MKTSKPFFPSGVQGQFYDQSGKIIGHSTASKMGLFLLIVELAIIFSSIILAFGREILFLANEQSMSDWYRSPVWAAIDAIPHAYFMTGWLLFLPLIYAIVGLFKDTHNKKTFALFTLSASVCGLLLWIVTALSKLSLLF